MFYGKQGGQYPYVLIADGWELDSLGNQVIPRVTVLVRERSAGDCLSWPHEKEAAE